MRKRRLSSVAGATGGRLVGEDREVRGVVVDSREARPGDLFVALPGDRTDGHGFVDDAAARGAVAALVQRSGDYGVPVVVVPDPAEALRALAMEERAATAATVVGITGSSGKTSVKDLTAAVLATRYRVSASPRSFNTEVGVPVTLLSAGETDEVIVCEMGARGPGHIRFLAETARPGVGVVTNVGLAHMEMFGSPRAVADAKAELVESLPPDGTAVLNADDPVVRDFAARTRARVLRFGTAPDADIRGEDLALDREGRPTFILRTPAGTEHVELALPGEHMALNALAAAGVGVALGLSPGECAAGLKEARLSPWRMEVFETAGGLRVINDAYNANPGSMAAALKALRAMAGSGRSIAVLGGMAELGHISEEEHARVGELLARLGIDRVVTVGDDARIIAVSAVREGLEPDRVRACRDIEEALEAMDAEVRSGDVILVKASRAEGLERLAERLREGTA